MSKCSICKRSVFDHPIWLHRTKPLGTKDEGTCMDCLKKHHPEKAKEVQARINKNPIYNDLSEILHGTPSRKKTKKTKKTKKKTKQ